MATELTSEQMTVAASAAMQAKADEIAMVEQGPMSMLERLAPTVDVAKLERLIDMQERILDRNAKAAFDAAFARMQAKIPTVIERGTADRGERGGTYSYARYEDVMEALRPVLHEFGFGIRHQTAYLDGGRVKVTGILAHAEGHSITSEFIAAADSGGGKNGVQAFGSSTSYGRRYTTYDLLGIATKGQDNDAGTAEQKPGPDGFEDWFADLIALADEGWARLSSTWNTAKPEFKNFVSKHRLQEWNKAKAKAQDVDRKAGQK